MGRNDPRVNPSRPSSAAGEGDKCRRRARSSCGRTGRLATVTNNSDLFFEMSCALGFRLDCQDKSPSYSPRQPALVLLVGAGKGIQRRREAVDLKVLEFALLRTDLYWTTHTGWLCRLVETEAEYVDFRATNDATKHRLRYQPGTVAASGRMPLQSGA
jgi:hypothetical protein